MTISNCFIVHPLQKAGWQRLYAPSLIINTGVSARLFEVSTGKLLQSFTHHANDMIDVAISHDGRWLAMASADKTATIWHVKN